ncbi:unnamed protein product [Cuscuta campestris]|uniref:TFIIS central domain-containing protein n=1 Tax=Cuscuta campestris TaxID=132261 RepID=A0A484NKD8_9ASTE|nr:unnamed protein product [Cuscuta campestris]
MVSNQQGAMGNVSTGVVGIQKLSVPSKRKAEGEPVVPSSSPRQSSSLANKRVGPQRPQMQPKASSTSSQGLLAPNKKAARNESFSSRNGSQRPQGPKGRAIQVDTVLKNQTDSSKAVRSKMRESLAGALALVCQRKDEPSNPAKGESEDRTGLQSSVELTTGFPELAVEDIPFSDNFFVKDDLLQGNGLTWVMDLDMEMGKEINEAANDKVQERKSPEDLALVIEEELFKLFGGVNKKYKEKGRSLLFNLKDPNNPELRERVMSGEILPERLCSMTAEELASKELSEWRTAKAEELAQMVVLPENDGDMRRLVKKTHKGEYEVEYETDDKAVSIAAEISAGATTSITTQFQRKPKVAKTKLASEDGESQSSADRISEKKQDLSGSLVIQTDETDLMQGMMVDEFKEADFLSPIVTLDEFMESLDSEPPFENLPAVDDATKKLPVTESTSEGPNNALLEDEDGKVIENQAEAVKKQIDPQPDVKSISNLTAKNELPTGNATSVNSIWEGALQLSISTAVAVMCCFRSGERTSTKDWKNPLEIKGRVRLDAFEKFIQQLPMSRSRAVMVVQFLLEDASSDDDRRCLSEAVDSYVSDGRVGFAEPAPGAELYLCPPRGRALEMLTNHLSKDFSELHGSIDDNTLVGVVVWRRHHHHPPPHHHLHRLTSTVSLDPKQQHTQQPVAQSSRRPHERDSDNFPPIVSSRPPPTPLPATKDDDDDDDIPPGFGPPKGGSRDDDDLPEFNFSGNTSSMRHPHPYPRAAAPLSDQMRQLVHMYGRTDIKNINNSNNINKPPTDIGIEPWNDDDDDDIPEWQPAPPPPVPGSGIHLPPPLQQPHSLSHPRMQNPHHVPNMSPRWPPVSPGTFGNQQQHYGAAVGRPPGGDYRRDNRHPSLFLLPDFQIRAWQRAAAMVATAIVLAGMMGYGGNGGTGAIMVEGDGGDGQRMDRWWS